MSDIHNSIEFVSLFTELSSRTSDVRLNAAKKIRSYVETCVRDMNSEDASVMLSELAGRVFDLMNRSEPHEKLGGLELLDEMIEFKSEFQETIIIRFANCFRILFQQAASTIDVVLEAAASALAHLARAGGALTVDFATSQIRECFRWLQSTDRATERRRLSAMLILSSLSTSVPTLFAPYTSEFLVLMWNALRDPNALIRAKSIIAFKAVLSSVSQREASWRHALLLGVYKQVHALLVGIRTAPHELHGALAVLDVMLEQAPAALAREAPAICCAVLAHKDSRSPLVAATVLALMPRLAALATDLFTREYLAPCVAHLLHAARTHVQDVAFVALGELALAVGDAMLPHLPPLVNELHAALAAQDKPGKPKGSARRSRSPACIFACLSMLAQPLGAVLMPSMERLLGKLFACGLTPALVSTLHDLARHMPPLLPALQDRLLATVAVILTLPLLPHAMLPHTLLPQHAAALPHARSLASALPQLLDSLLDAHAHAAGAAGAAALGCLHTHPPLAQRLALALTLAQAHTHNLSVGGMPRVAAGKVDEEVVLLALHTLATFPFDLAGPRLLVLLRDCVARFLDLTFPHALRHGAACALLALLPALFPHLHTPSAQTVGCELLRRLVASALHDPAPAVRAAVLAQLPARMAVYLAQPDILPVLALALRDEALSVREAAVRLLGPVLVRNPAVARPPLHRLLVQLLHELHQWRTGARELQAGCRLLALLIEHCSALVRPFAMHTLAVLVSKLPRAHGSPALHALQEATLQRALAQALRALQTEPISAVPVGVPLLGAAADHDADHGDGDARGAAGALGTAPDMLAMLSARASMLSEEHAARTTTPELAADAVDGGLQGEGGGVAGVVGADLIPAVLSALGALTAICPRALLGTLQGLVPLTLAVASAGTAAMVAGADATAAAPIGDAGAGGTASERVVEHPDTHTVASSHAVAMRTLHQLLSASGRVLPALCAYPALLPVLHSLFAAQHAAQPGGAAHVPLRVGLVRVLGVFGAVDPRLLRTLRHGHTLAMVGGRLVLVPPTGVRRAQLARQHGRADAELLALESLCGPETAADLDPFLATATATAADGLRVPGGELCYPRVAVAELLRVLEDTTLSQLHNLAVSALMYVFKAAGPDAPALLPQLMPALLAALSACTDPVLAESFLLHLHMLVVSARVHMQPHLPAAIHALLAQWRRCKHYSPDALVLPRVLAVILQLADACGLAFSPYVAVVAARMLAVLTGDATDARVHMLVVLRALQVLCAHPGFAAHVHTLLPTLVQLAQPDEAQPTLGLLALQALARLTATTDVTAHASPIFHVLARVLAVPDPLPSYSSCAPVLIRTHAHALAALCALARQLATAFLVFEPLFRAPTQALCRRVLADMAPSALPSAHPLLSATAGAPFPLVGDMAATATADVVVAVPSPTHARAPAAAPATAATATPLALGLLGAGPDALTARDAAEAEDPLPLSVLWSLCGLYRSLTARLRVTAANITQPSRAPWPGLSTSSAGSSTASANPAASSHAQHPHTSYAHPRVPAAAPATTAAAGSVAQTGPGVAGGPSRWRAGAGAGAEGELAEEAEGTGTTLGVPPQHGWRLALAGDARAMHAVDWSPYARNPWALWHHDKAGSAIATTAAHTQTSSTLCAARADADTGALVPGAPAATLPFLPRAKLRVGQAALAKAAHTAGRATRDDWVVWLRGLAIELLRESPSAALRACSPLAGKHPPLAAQLLRAAFLSCWEELDDQHRDILADSLAAAMAAPELPAAVGAALLSLCEFMERQQRALPFSASTLARLAERVQDTARALRYRELEHAESTMVSAETIASLLSLNRQLGFVSAARGVLALAQRERARQKAVLASERAKANSNATATELFHAQSAGANAPALEAAQCEHCGRPRQELHARATPRQGDHTEAPGVHVLGGTGSVAVGVCECAAALARDALRVDERWFEELGEWAHALAAYTRTQLAAPDDLRAMLGRMRCFEALGEWGSLAQLAQHAWTRLSSYADPDAAQARERISALGAQAALAGSRWDLLNVFARHVSAQSGEGAVYRAALALHANDLDAAARWVDRGVLQVAERLGSAAGGALRATVRNSTHANTSSAAAVALGREGVWCDWRGTTRPHMHSALPSLSAEVVNAYAQQYEHAVTLHQLVELHEVLQYKLAQLVSPGARAPAPYLPLAAAAAAAPAVPHAPHTLAAKSAIAARPGLRAAPSPSSLPLPALVVPPTAPPASAPALSAATAAAGARGVTGLSPELSTGSPTSSTSASAVPLPPALQRLCAVWMDRLQLLAPTPRVWQRVLGIRGLLLQPQQQLDAWVQFATLAREHGHAHTSLLVLHRLLGVDSEAYMLLPQLPLPTHHPEVALALIRHQYHRGHTRAAYARLLELVASPALARTDGATNTNTITTTTTTTATCHIPPPPAPAPTSTMSTTAVKAPKCTAPHDPVPVPVRALGHIPAAHSSLPSPTSTAATACLPGDELDHALAEAALPPGVAPLTTSTVQAVRAAQLRAECFLTLAQWRLSALETQPYGPGRGDRACSLHGATSSPAHVAAHTEACTEACASDAYHGVYHAHYTHTCATPPPSPPPLAQETLASAPSVASFSPYPGAGPSAAPEAAASTALARTTSFASPHPGASVCVGATHAPGYALHTSSSFSSCSCSCSTTPPRSPSSPAAAAGTGAHPALTQTCSSACSHTASHPCAALDTGADADAAAAGDVWTRWLTGHLGDPGPASGVAQALYFLRQATLHAPANARAWHEWSMLNFRLASQPYNPAHYGTYGLCSLGRDQLCSACVAQGAAHGRAPTSLPTLAAHAHTPLSLALSSASTNSCAGVPPAAAPAPALPAGAGCSPAPSSRAGSLNLLNLRGSINGYFSVAAPAPVPATVLSGGQLAAAHSAVHSRSHSSHSHGPAAALGPAGFAATAAGPSSRAVPPHGHAWHGHTCSQAAPLVTPDAFVVPALRGFFQSVSLAVKAPTWSPTCIQDILRILAIWLAHGHRASVAAEVARGIASVPIETWLDVLPQVLARLHTPHDGTRAGLVQLVCAVGDAHPQALLYSVAVASKGAARRRREAAEHVLSHLTSHSPQLVAEAQMVATELVRVSMLWGEMWREALEEAARQYFALKQAGEMVRLLAPLHALLERGGATVRELQFQQQHSRELAEAYESLKRFAYHAQLQLPGVELPLPAGVGAPVAAQAERYASQAWEVYSAVFRKLAKQQVGAELDLAQVSPALLHARELLVAIPGTYVIGRPVVRIAGFQHILRVIDSKQHPRSLVMRGSDGQQYRFLLKGHEDLRQDERVMQLFGLVNALLSSDGPERERERDHEHVSGADAEGLPAEGGGEGPLHHLATRAASGAGLGGTGVELWHELHSLWTHVPRTAAAAGPDDGDSLSLCVSMASVPPHALSIVRYSVTPLSPNSGLIEWVPHTDTLFALIKELRDARHVVLNIEQRIMLKFAPDLALLTVPQRVEAFEYCLARTSSDDLAQVAWLKAGSARRWLARRHNYTRSLAVMSMVGYVLGLGDRHPCNLMLDRASGKIIHIDFGDCFEVAMHRDKFPEKVPFRLTRMLVRAMAVAQLEGAFRLTCEHAMRVLRHHRNSVMAVLEAFVYDPLMTWRLFGAEEEQEEQEGQRGTATLHQPTATTTTTTVLPHSGPASSPPPPPPPARQGFGQPAPTVAPALEQMPAPLPLPVALDAIATRALSFAHSPACSLEEAVPALTQRDSTLARASGNSGNSVYRAPLALGSQALRALHTDADAEAKPQVSTQPQPHQLAADPEGLGRNAKALSIVRRVEAKLRGRDFPEPATEQWHMLTACGQCGHEEGSCTCAVNKTAGEKSPGEALTIAEQVQRLILDATAHDKLCQCYIGWCYYW